MPGRRGKNLQGELGRSLDRHQDRSRCGSAPAIAHLIDELVSTHKACGWRVGNGGFRVHGYCAMGTLSRADDGYGITIGIEIIVKDVDGYRLAFIRRSFVMGCLRRTIFDSNLDGGRGCAAWASGNDGIGCGLPWSDGEGTLDGEVSDALVKRAVIGTA